MTSYRWDRERSAYLIAHSRSGTSRRRHGELLSRRSRQAAREAAGVGATLLHDDVTPPLWRRMLSDNDAGESLARVFFMIIGFCLFVTTIGPAVAMGRGLYAALWAVSPKIGRLWTWPLLVTSAVAVVAGWPAVLAHPGDINVGLLTRLPIFDISFTGGSYISAWLLWSLALAPAMASYFVWSWGWAGVPRKAVAPAVMNSDGTFREKSAAEKVKLFPTAPREVAAPMTDRLVPEWGQTLVEEEAELVEEIDEPAPAVVAAPRLPEPVVADESEAEDMADDEIGFMADNVEPEAEIEEGWL